MEAGYFIIAILGCADGSIDCKPVMTVPTRYESESACAAAAPEALLENSNFDFPSLLAECRGITRPAAADKPSSAAGAASSRA